ncbi:SDR family NAD(P)-dependent oxidoreductase [Actinokineospora iranica]|uniref:Short-chain dehydrogenase n=1 Tax=Actinokineospora iranica TaxID=1271860 RepID=A0A1G6UR78_9PSEU|nr:SDR family NAD(P)-dependent oxidoreductase [Actinokineospora iranica]SDD43754.1 Short-chain dehydrogenase [Actinokineospora iranica]
MNDQVWFITGAGSGFGHALSRAVLAAGGRVAAGVRSPDTGAVATLREAGPGRVGVVKIDVRDASQVQRGVDRVADEFGRVDVVVNGAGRGSFGSVEETPDDEVRDLFEVNFFGSLNVIRAVLPVLRRQGRGHVVQLSSLAGVAPPAPGLGAYAATKFAVEGMNEVLAREVAHLGIGVTIVEPGDFATGFGRALHVTPPALDDYLGSVGKAADAFASTDPSLLGDPDKAAVAIIDAVRATKPPLRLVLGGDAVDAIGTSLSTRLDELRCWEEVGRGTR